MQQVQSLVHINTLAMIGHCAYDRILRAVPLSSAARLRSQSGHQV